MVAARASLALFFAVLPGLSACQKAQADTTPEPGPAPQAVEIPAAPAAQPEAAPAGPRTLKISAVGDCTLGGPFESEGAPGTFSFELAGHDNDARYPFAKVLSVLAADDLTIANLETTLTNEKHAQSRPFSFRGSPAFAEVLKQGSVEVVNVANNHSYDFGLKGYAETVEVVRAAGVGVSGNEWVDVRTIRGVEVVNVGFLGGNLRQKAKMIALVTEHKTPKNLVFVSFHWGVEGVNAPTVVQYKLGRAAIDAGADLVIGTHPHVLQGIETYKGKHIVYSLGNFVFGGNVNPADKDAVIFQETFTEEGGRFLPGEPTLLPVRISSDEKRNDYQPVLLEGKERDRVLGRIKTFSDALMR
ncbi:MAG: CapA family protein [Byssovorax sp.]